MDSQKPKPPIPANVDLHDFSFVPIFRTQLFRSAFHARATDSEWRAGVTLWLKSWDQLPAGSLPNDDVELCRLAELGRAIKTWRKLKPMAMHGWYICEDNRFYHQIVAEGVLAAFSRRKSAQERGKLGNSVRWRLVDGGLSDSSAIAEGSGNGAKIIAIPRKGQGQGQGQGQGEGDKNKKKTQEAEAHAARAPVATRLPDGFKLTSERTEYATEQGIDPVRAFENFSDYWKAASGAKARKLDWDATWRMWCRREGERRGGNSRTMVARPKTLDEIEAEENAKR